jgi:DNA-binding response OmpR family regulator
MEGPGSLLDHDKKDARNVLLVDDEVRLRGILARYLRARGHHVIEATSATEACVALDTALVDVLVLDVNLAVDTGWEVLRWLEACPDAAGDRPRVVILSAVPPSAKRIAQFAPDAVLNKPFPIDALARLVETECRPASASSDFD